MVVDVARRDTLVVAGRVRRVLQGIGIRRADRVVRLEEPGLGLVQDAFARDVAALRLGERDADQRIDNAHVRKRRVARVRHGEPVGDLLADLRRARPGLDQIDPGGDIERHRVFVARGRRVAQVIALCRGVVYERVRIGLRDRVGPRVDPGLGDVQDAIAVRTVGPLGDVPAEQQVRHGHVFERDVPRVRDREPVGDLLAELGRTRPGLRDRDPGGDRERHGVPVRVLHHDLPEVRAHGHVVFERVRCADGDRVRRRVGPGLGLVQDAVAGDVAACRAGHVAADQHVFHGHVRERDVARVRDLKRVRDLLADHGRTGSGLDDHDSGSEIERQGVRVVVGRRVPEVVARRGRCVRERVRIGIRDRVGPCVDPGLGDVQDAVAVRAVDPVGDVSAKERIIHGHVPEGHVAHVRHLECIRDRLPERGRIFAGLVEIDPGGDVERERVSIALADGGSHMLRGDGRVVLQGVGSADGNPVGRRILPGLGQVQEGVAVRIAARRPRYRAEERVREDDVRERDIARVRDVERIGDRLVDPGRTWAGLHDLDPRRGGVEGHVPYVRVGCDAPQVVAGDTRVVQDGAGIGLFDRVGPGIDPGLGDVQDAVTVGAVDPVGDVPAEQQVRHGHVPKWDVPRIRDRECKGAHLAEPGRVGAGLLEADSGGDVQRHRMGIRMGDRLPAEVAGHGRGILDRVGSADRDRVVPVIVPRLGRVQDAVVAIVAGRRSCQGAAPERVGEAHVPEGHVSGVRHRERIGDRLADPGRDRSRLRDRDPRGDVEGHGVGRHVGRLRSPEVPGRGRRVLDRAHRVGRDRVVPGINPGLGGVQDAVVAAVTRRRSRQGAAPERVREAHVPEGHVSGVRHRERVGDRLADPGRTLARLLHVHGGGDIEGRGVLVAVADGDFLVVPGRGRVVQERVHVRHEDRVIRRVYPDLGLVQDAVAGDVAALRAGDVVAEQGVFHGHVPERRVPGVRDRERVGDLLADRRRARPGLRDCDPGSEVERDRVVVRVGGVALVIALRRRRIHERVRIGLPDRVGRAIGPGLGGVQNTVVVDVTAVGVRKGDADQRIDHAHVREWDVARVRHVERVRDRLAEYCRRRPGLLQLHGGSDVERQGVPVAVGDGLSLVGAGRGRIVRERVRGTRRDRIGRRVVPDLVEVQDMVAIRVPFDEARDGAAEQGIVDGHVRERDIPAVRHVERVGDLLADHSRARPGLRELYPGREVEGHAPVVRVGRLLFLVIALRGRGVRERVRYTGRHEVGRGVDPGLAPVQDAVAGDVALHRARDVPVEQRVVHRHIPERYVSGVRDRECVLDLLADHGLART